MAPYSIMEPSAAATPFLRRMASVHWSSQTVAESSYDSASDDGNYPGLVNISGTY